MRMRRVLKAAVVTVAVVTATLAGCGDETEEPDTRASDATPTPANTGLTGRVLLGPQCPVETVDDPCDDQPAAGVPVIVSEQLPGEAYAAGEEVARTTTGADGTYRVAVAPGAYVVTADAGMSCEIMDATVTAGAYATADVPCDTGIR